MFEIAKGVIRRHKSKENTMSPKNTKRQTMRYKTLQRNLKIEQYEPHQILGVHSGVPEG